MSRTRAGGVAKAVDGADWRRRAVDRKSRDMMILGCECWWKEERLRFFYFDHHVGF